MKNIIRNPVVGVVNVLSGGSMGKITVGELRDVEKLYSLGEASEIAQNEITDLDNWKEVANMDEKEEIGKMQEIKEGEKKDLNTRVKKLKKEIEKNDLEKLIVDRSKSTDGVNNQIDFLANNFKNWKKRMKEANWRTKKKKK